MLCRYWLSRDLAPPPSPCREVSDRLERKVGRSLDTKQKRITSLHARLASASRLQPLISSEIFVYERPLLASTCISQNGLDLPFPIIQINPSGGVHDGANTLFISDDKQLFISGAFCQWGFSAAHCSSHWPGARSAGISCVASITGSPGRAQRCVQTCVYLFLFRCSRMFFCFFCWTISMHTFHGLVYLLLGFMTFSFLVWVWSLAVVGTVV